MEHPPRWGAAPVPGEMLLPAGLGLASLAVSALPRWRVRPSAVPGRARAGSSAAWGTARAGEAGEGRRGGGQPAAHRESRRVVPVARGLVSVMKQHPST